MDGVEWLELCKRSHLDEKKIDGHVDDESDVWRCFLFFLEFQFTVIYTVGCR